MKTLQTQSPLHRRFAVTSWRFVVTHKRFAVFAAIVGLSATLLAFHVAAAAVGNGSGINGPDWAGVSIPAVLDQSFAETDLDNTLRSCGAQGLKPLADVLQTKGSAINFFTATQATVMDDANQVRHVSRTFSAQGTAIGAGRGSDSGGEPSCAVSFNDQSASAGFYKTSLVLSGCAVGDGAYFSTEALPHYEYDISMNNVRFDEWGNPIGGAPIITQLRVVPLNSSAHLKIINPKSGQPIALTFNAAAMSACMKAQAQRSR